MIIFLRDRSIGGILALLYCVSRASAVAQAPVVRMSVKRIFSETVKRINARICEKAAIHHTYRPFFSIFKYSIFEFLNFFIFVNMGSYGSENFKTLLHVQL